MSDNSDLCLKNRFLTQEYDFLSDTIIFDFQSTRNRCKFSKITHLPWYHTSISISASLLKLPKTSRELSEQYRFHLERPVEQIEIAFPNTISTNLHIFPFYAGASIEDVLFCSKMGKIYNCSPMLLYVV